MRRNLGGRPLERKDMEPHTSTTHVGQPKALSSRPKLKSDTKPMLLLLQPTAVIEAGSGGSSLSSSSVSTPRVSPWSVSTWSVSTWSVSPSSARQAAAGGAVLHQA